MKTHVLVPAVLFLVACGGDRGYVQPNPGGPMLPGSAPPPTIDMAKPSSTQHATVRDRCERLWGALCDQWIACGVVTGEAAANCVDLTVDSCCAGSQCVSTDTANPAAVELCEDDLLGASCALIVYDAQNRQVPSSCQGLLF